MASPAQAWRGGSDSDLPPGLAHAHAIEYVALTYRGSNDSYQLQCRCGEPLGSAIAHRNAADIHAAFAKALDHLVDGPEGTIVQLLFPHTPTLQSLAVRRGGGEHERLGYILAVRNAIVAGDDLEAFDTEACEWRRDRIARAFRLRQQARRMRPRSDFMSDEEWKLYSRSRRWRLKLNACRRAANGLDGEGCYLCGLFAEIAHHKTYERVGNEPPEDLEALCHRCHAWVHGRPIPWQPTPPRPRYS